MEPAHPSEHPAEHPIAQNAIKLRALNARVSETYRDREISRAAHADWQAARAAFDAAYNHLAFPGGADSAKSRILAGNPDAVDNALAFLELRPYFFRATYMRNDFFRFLKRLYRENPQAFSDTQLDRFIVVMEAREQPQSATEDPTDFE